VRLYKLFLIKMEDLISFEDLVVQPFNSYFNLEKELHEVKSRLSLMDERLKYLESAKKSKKRNKKPTDIVLKDEKKIQVDRAQRLINRNEVRKKNEELQLKRKEEWKKWDKEREEEITKEANDKIVNTVIIEENYILVDNIVFEDKGGYQGMEKYLSNYTLIKELIISKRFLLTLLYYNNEVLHYFLKPNSLKIEKLTLYLSYFFGIIDRIIELNFKCNTIELCGNTFYRKSSTIKNLQKYCLENKIELIF